GVGWHAFAVPSRESILTNPTAKAWNCQPMAPWLQRLRMLSAWELAVVYAARDRRKHATHATHRSPASKCRAVWWGGWFAANLAPHRDVSRKCTPTIKVIVDLGRNLLVARGSRIPRCI